MGARENKFQISQELRKHDKIVMRKISFCETVLNFVFSGSHKNLFFLFHITYYYYFI